MHYFFTLDNSIPDLSMLQSNSENIISAQIDPASEWIIAASDINGESICLALQSQNSDTNEVRKELELVEDVFFNEIYRTHRFFRIIEGVKSDLLCFEFLWDYTPFFQTYMIMPQYIQKYGLEYDYKECIYKKRNKQNGHDIWGKCIFVNGYSRQLLIHKKFYNELQRDFKVSWVNTRNGDIIICPKSI